jgi:hypothetical protein
LEEHMAKKIYHNGRRVHPSELTPRQLRIETLLTAQKVLTAEWYKRMSGEIEWKPGEKEENQRRSDAISVELKTLWADEAVDQFVTLSGE